jgi:hypothetical protein
MNQLHMAQDFPWTSSSYATDDKRLLFVMEHKASTLSLQKPAIEAYAKQIQSKWPFSHQVYKRRKRRNLISK